MNILKMSEVKRQVFLEEQMYPFCKPVRTRRTFLSRVCKYKLGQAKEGPFPPWGRGVEGKQTTERERWGQRAC